MALELDGIWISSTFKPFFWKSPSCLAMNIPLWAPVTAVQLMRTFFCAHADSARVTSKKSKQTIL